MQATLIFSAKNIRILYIESAKTVNEMTLNELVKLMTLWTTGPRKKVIIQQRLNKILFIVETMENRIQNKVVHTKWKSSEHIENADTQPEL